MWLQTDAMNALPPDLKSAAMIIDHDCPPPNRPWPTWATPPVKGFDKSQFEDADMENEESDDEVSKAVGKV